jgi:RHS repeat-associated protein
MKARSIRLNASLCLLLSITAARAADFGETTGYFAVSSSGAATYSIPIWTPPGPNGLAPSISLDYNSQGGNGLAGVGWNLSAVSSIERCRRTKHQDGDNTEVNFTGGNAGDRFCIAGNRLRLTTVGGTYGAANTTYQTEFADFARITALGQVGAGGTGPLSFKVETKSGLIYEYGNDVGSKVTAGAGSTILRWMLNKVSDRSGNNYVVSYNNTAGQGFAVPNTISWTPVSSGATTYKYQAAFNYINNRTDKDSYLGRVTGIAISNRYRLENIQIKADGVVVRQYLLSYGTSPVTQISRLGQIQECADGTTNNCLLPTTFTYQAGQAGLSAGAGTTPAGSSNNIVKGRYDLNGDGKDDLLYKASGLFHASFGLNAGFSSPVSTGASTCGTVGRFLPNGRDALIISGSPLTAVRWNDATSSFVSVSMGFNLVHSALRAADYDGDGLDDIIAPASKKIPVYRNTSTGTGNPTFSLTPVDTLPILDPQVTYSTVDRYVGGIRTVDFNGDGREEMQAKLARTVGGGSGSTFFTGALRFTDASGPSAGSSSVNPYSAMDFNGDACIDRRQNASIEISSCAGISASTITAPASPILVLDWDGDGKTDLLVDNGGTFGVYLSTGNGFSSLITTSIPSSGTFFAVDQDGDGLDDIVKVNGTGAINYWTHTSSGLVGTFATNIPDLLTNVTDGFGATQVIKYASTAWPNYYDKGSETAAPLQEADPRIVVGEVTSDNGFGGTYNKNYFYVGDRENADRGKEPAGFQRMDETDSRSGIVTRTYYEQLFPKAGLLWRREALQSSGTLISRSDFVNTSVELEPGAFNQRYFRYVSKVTETRNEVGPKNGQTIATSVTDFTDVDAANGNIRRIDTVLTDTDTGAPASPTAGAAWTRKTELQFSPDTGTNWCLGIPTQTKTTLSSTAAGSGAAVVRTVTAPLIDYAKCRVRQTVVEPLSGTYKVTTDIEYDDDAGNAQPDFGNVTKLTVQGINMTARVTSMTWTSGGQFPLTVTNALNQNTTFGYDFARGLQTSITDANGLVASTDYDAFGRQIKSTRVDGTASQIRRADCTTTIGCSGNIRGVVYFDELAIGGATIKTDYSVIDKYARPIQTWTKTLNTGANELYSMVNVAYDSLGHVASRSAPCLTAYCSPQYLTNYSYDIVGRPTLISRPVSAGSPITHNTTIAYKGATTEVTDAQSKKTTSVSDPNGWRRQTRDHDSYGQDFTFDGAGSLLTVTDTSGLQLLKDVSYAYGVNAFQTAATDADLGPRTQTFNALGELVAWSDAKSQNFSATFDALSRPLTRVEPEQKTVWVWGSASDNTATAKYIGNLRDIRTETLGGSLIYKDSYTYDAKARPAQHTITIPGEPTYTYDFGYSSTLGLLETVDYPSTVGARPRAAYVYQYGQLQKVTNGAATPYVYWEAKKTNELHAVVEEAFGNNLTTRRSIDPIVGWTNYIHTGVTGSSNETSIQNLSFLYDYVGNVTQRQNGILSLTENFHYDNLYRLDDSQVTGQTFIDYAYQANGNISSMTGAGSYNYTTPQAGCSYYTHAQPHAVRSVGSTVYCYDANGNMTKRGGSTQTFTSYNYPSQLLSGSQSAQFSYGPDRQRWKMIFNDGSTTDTTLYIGGAVERVTVGSTTTYRHTISANGAPVAILTRTSAGVDTLRYVLSDHQGSIETLATSGGATDKLESFTPFGDRRNANTWAGAPSAAERLAMDAITRQGYTFHSALGAMGLNHMNGRVQDAVSGRFLSADPFVTDPGNSQSYNRYSYVSNNPLSFVDPSGFTPGTLTCPAVFSWPSAGNRDERVYIYSCGFPDYRPGAPIEPWGTAGGPPLPWWPGPATTGGADSWLGTGQLVADRVSIDIRLVANPMWDLFPALSAVDGINVSEIRLQKHIIPRHASDAVFPQKVLNGRFDSRILNSKTSREAFADTLNRLFNTGSVTYAGPAQKPGGMLIQILDSTNIGYSRDGVTPTPMWNIVLVPIPGMKGIWQVWTAFPADASSDGSE